VNVQQWEPGDPVLAELYKGADLGDQRSLVRAGCSPGGANADD
jgi:hypothetical protein